MGIKANFNKDFITKRFNQSFANIEKAIVQNLTYLGEQCIIVARDEGNYIDQTGNLRSSTGFIVLFNGKVLNQKFITANKDEEGKGVKTGLLYALEVAKNYQTGYVLIVVAGMGYAAAVESKSRDVLTSAEKFAEKEMPKLIKRLKKGIAKQK